ncbi:hypothetical protein TNIN_314251 [Trichonephila inaurata madagascariensis]|uniref:Uncharacterized protein n=1 Tax=Trichonephila inaurata madagascariensis TaxID=2747483 RepID=A0A8X6WXN2_9ARAC|nr:hypothetical protein TNIN_314251 [Trichonephila inaurata madagascariensis]
MDLFYSCFFSPMTLLFEIVGTSQPSLRLGVITAFLSPKKRARLTQKGIKITKQAFREDQIPGTWQDNSDSIAMSRRKFLTNEFFRLLQPKKITT